jgi:serine protease
MVQTTLNQSTALIGMPAAYTAAGATGAGRMVAILDTGVQSSHPFMSGRVSLEACRSGGGVAANSLCPNGTMSQDGPGAAEPCASGCSHGTHVAGIAAGNQGSGNPSNGVAKDAGIFAVQVFTKTSSGVGAYTSDINAALDLVLQKHATYPIDAVNLSLGGGMYSGTCDTASTTTTSLMNSLRSVGVATVVAAGNNSYGYDISWPACITSAIAVGSSDKIDQISYFTNISSKVELMAPGSEILSSVPNGYAVYNGTSMATPHVAGVFAAIRSKIPTATVLQILDALKKTGVTIWDTRFAGSLSKPRVQVDAALALLSGTPAAMTSPAANSILTDSSQMFSWDKGVNVSQYWLYVGTTGAGSSDINSQFTGGLTSTTVTGLPINGQKIYVRLASMVGGFWRYNDYVYTAPTAAAAYLTSPYSYDTLTGPSQTFTWTAGKLVTQYKLEVGTSAGAANIATVTGTSLSATVSGMPVDGRMVYAQLSSLIGGVWQKGYGNTYFGFTGVKASLTSPYVFGSTGTLTAPSQRFMWTGGKGVSEYYLEIGTAGTGSSNLYSRSAGTAVSAYFGGLPVNGSSVNVRLWSFIPNPFGSSWQYADYILTAAVVPGTRAAMTSPSAGGATLAPTQTFSWLPGISVTEYHLEIGTTEPGSNNLYNKTAGTALSAAVTLPATSSTVYVRLWSFMSGYWVYNDTTYISADGRAAMTTPAAGGAALASALPTFNWNAGIGVSEYWLHVGTAAGKYDLYNKSAGTALTAQVASVPATGSPVYVRLWSLVSNGAWQFRDYTYTSVDSRAAMTSPGVNGSSLGGSSYTFAWTAGTEASEYWLEVGTTLGARNLYDKTAGSTLSAAVAGLPANGATIYVRLWSRAYSSWVYRDYTYTFNGVGVMTSPAGGTKLTGTSQVFNWTQGTGVAEYWLEIGTTGAGSVNIYNKSAGTAQTATVPALPSNSSPVYVRLWSRIPGALSASGTTGGWEYIDYTYTSF